MENIRRRRRGLTLATCTEQDSMDWSYLLTARQKEYLAEYERGSPDVDAFNLGQDPRTRPAVARSGVFPTVARNFFILVVAFGAAVHVP